MTLPTILVTGATGKTGSAVVAQLLQQGWPVKAVVHARDARSVRLDRLGAQTVVADLFDPEQLELAMQGTQRAYYCPPFHPYMIQSAVAFAIAARRARLESIVGLTQWLASPSHPSLATRQHWLVDHLFSMVPDLAFTIVNPGFFAEYPYLRLTRYAAHLGIFPMPGDPESRNAPPSNDDIARVAVAALVDPRRHAGRTYRPTGPQLLSLRDMAGTLGKVLDRKVVHLPIPMWMFYRAAGIEGISAFELSGMRHYIEEQNRGAFAFGGPTEDVLEATGRPPEAFETIARRHAATASTQRTVARQLRTLVEFLSVPMRRGFDAEQFDHHLGLPVPGKTQLNMDNPRWLAEHARPALAQADLALGRAVAG
jgi:uncharacterized protein YbjT (DUF2867 family)